MKTTASQDRSPHPLHFRRIRSMLAVSALLLSACNSGCSSGPTPYDSPEDFGASKNNSGNETSLSKASGLEFDADRAYDAILKYEKFGPKVPGSKAHAKAGDWIVKELKNLGAEVIEQKTTVKNSKGKKIPVRNIIGRIRPSATVRYLLSAHWDNRPVADQDTKKKNKPIVGTNDGGSGVAVLLGIARAYSVADGAKKEEKPAYGVDLFFWDAEDGGDAGGADWCLGSQYWAEHPVPADYTAKFGINFDMVGRTGSVFPAEGHSFTHAAKVLKKIRKAAKTLGHQDYFPNVLVEPINDDHYYIMEGRGFSVADVIALDPGTGRFVPEWHTHNDTAKVISRDVLKAVAQTALEVLASESHEPEKK